MQTVRGARRGIALPVPMPARPYISLDPVTRTSLGKRQALCSVSPELCRKIKTASSRYSFFISAHRCQAGYCSPTFVVFDVLVAVSVGWKVPDLLRGKRRPLASREFPAQWRAQHGAPAGWPQGEPHWDADYETREHTITSDIHDWFRHSHEHPTTSDTDSKSGRLAALVRSCRIG